MVDLWDKCFAKGFKSPDKKGGHLRAGEIAMNI